MSVPYINDDMTWCIQSAKFYPKWVTMLLCFKPEVWLFIIFVYGYGNGIILYFLIQFDKNYVQRNIRDFHYMTWLISLPMTIGLCPGFRPMSGKVRAFYAFMLMIDLILFQIAFFTTFNFLKLRVPFHQVSTIDELIEDDYYLMGSKEVLDVVRSTEKVKSIHDILIFVVRRNFYTQVRVCNLFAVSGQPNGLIFRVR